MTIADRNRVFLACSVVEAAMAAVFGAAAALCLGLPAGKFATLGLKPEFSWEPRILVAIPLQFRSLATAGALCLWSLLWGVWIFRSFRKTTSYEVLFFAVFAGSLSFEGARGLVALCAALEAPAAYSAWLSRAAFMGRWAGGLSLFAASLYAVGLQHEKAGRDIAIVLFLSAIFAAVMPVNTGVLMESFILRPGYPAILGWSWASLSLLTLVDYLFAAFLRGSRDYVVMAAGVLLMMAGRIVLLSMTDALFCSAGIALLILGGWLFMRACFRRALWQ